MSAWREVGRGILMGSEGVVEVERGLGMRRENEKGVGSS